MPIQEERSAGPDQAVGWLIALACFFINFIMAGLARTAGVLYVALIELYGVSREAATTPFSIRVCVRNMTGPLIGLLGLKYGIRKVTTIGGFVAALGSILCYFAPNILWITMFWGVIHGIGFGLSTVIHMMIINQYFDKYKASALGLGYAGDCFGTFAFPVIMEYLLANYNVKETFLILGAIVLNVIPMALLLRKPPWLKSKKKLRNSIKDITSADNQANGKEFEGYRNEGYINYDEGLASSGNCNGESPHANKVEFGKPADLPPYTDSISKNRFNMKSERLSANGSFRSLRTSSEYHRDNMERHDSLPPVLEKDSSLTGSSGFETIAFDDVTPQCESSNTCGDTERVQRSASVKKRASSFVGQMAVDIVHRMRSASFASQVAQDGFISNFQQDQSEDSELEDQYRGQRRLSLDENGCCKSCGQEVVLSVNDPRLDDMREPSQLSFPTQPLKPVGVLETLITTNIKPIFILISASMAVYAFLFVGVLTIIIDYAVDQGVSNDQGKYLIIGFSVTDLFGRLSFGQIIDRKLIKMKNYSGVTMLLMGTLVAVIPLNKSFNYMMICMCLYGFVQGGTAIMFPILVSHYMEKNEESVAMGCLNFYGGLLMLCMAPMIGYFRDNTGSYNWVFHILGGMVALIGIIWQLEPLILKFQRKQQLKRANHVVNFKL